MTRGHAIGILKSRCFGITDTGQAGKWIDALEALGLLKFEEEKEISPSMIIKERLSNIGVAQPMIMADEIVNFLMRGGYKIVKAK